MPHTRPAVTVPSSLGIFSEVPFMARSNSVCSSEASSKAATYGKSDLDHPHLTAPPHSAPSWF